MAHQVFTDMFKAGRDISVGRDIKAGTQDTNIENIDHSNHSSTISGNKGVVSRDISGTINQQRYASKVVRDCDIEEEISVLIKILNRELMFNLPKGSTLKDLKQRAVEDGILKANEEDLHFKIHCKKFNKEVEISDSYKLKCTSEITLYK